MLVSLLQSYRWVRLEELANKFPQNILFESRRRKLQRLLTLPQLTVEQIWFPLFSCWLEQNFANKQVLFIAVVKYVGRVQEHSRKPRRHSSFYLGKTRSFLG